MSKDRRQRSVKRGRICTRPNLYIYHHFAMSSPKAKPSPTMTRNPRYLRLSYLSFFVIQTFDCFLFTSLSPFLFTDRSILNGPTQFFIRANAATLFPLVLLIFMLKKHHVSTEVGRTVASVFVLFHALVLGLVSWHAYFGPWVLGQYIASFAFHGAWMASGIVALAGY